MAAPITATITYAGNSLSAQITASPWSMIGVQFPEHGGPPTSPQFYSDVLQPMFADAARYRRGGAHFVKFRMITILGVADYPTAQTMARMLELCQGDNITLGLAILPAVSPMTFFAHAVRAVPVPKPVLGGIIGSGGFGAAATVNACVDTEWMLQAVAS